jgi:hypothetical protein
MILLQLCVAVHEVTELLKNLTVFYGTRNAVVMFNIAQNWFVL